MSPLLLLILLLLLLKTLNFSVQRGSFLRVWYSFWRLVPAWHGNRHNEVRRTKFEKGRKWNWWKPREHILTGSPSELKSLHFFVFVFSRFASISDACLLWNCLLKQITPMNPEFAEGCGICLVCIWCLVKPKKCRFVMFEHSSSGGSYLSWMIWAWSPQFRKPPFFQVFPNGAMPIDLSMRLFPPQLPQYHFIIIRIQRCGNDH